MPHHVRNPRCEWHRAQRAFGQKYWRDLAEVCDENVCEMARRSGIARVNVYPLLSMYGVTLRQQVPASNLRKRLARASAVLVLHEAHQQ